MNGWHNFETHQAASMIFWDDRNLRIATCALDSKFDFKDVVDLIILKQVQKGTHEKINPDRINYGEIFDALKQLEVV